jgi:TrmH family RNA methyltransferase
VVPVVDLARRFPVDWRSMRVASIQSVNDSFQILCALRDNRRKRAKRGEIFVEGVAAINALAATGRSAVSVAYADGRRLSGWARETIERLQPHVAYELSADLMESLSARTDPSELVVVAERPGSGLSDLPAPAADSVYVVVDRPSNHGNLGSLLRSAEAFGVSGVVTTGHGVDPFDPQVIRASLGACFYQTVVHEESSGRLLGWIEGLRRRETGLRVYGTDSKGSVPLAECTLRRPTVVVFGNEATGMSASLFEMVDETVSIEIGGRVNSLNLACAASIVLYHLRPR